MSLRLPWTKAGQSTGKTITALKLSTDNLDRSNPQAFAKALRAAVTEIKDQRLDWYLAQMRSRSQLVNGLPRFSAVMGTIGVLFSAGTVVARALFLADVIEWGALDVVMMSVAVVAYALMSASLLYERLVEGAGGYFRATTTVVAIRDLWSSYQFADIGRALAPPSADPESEIKRWLDPAHEFCKALDAIVAAEMIEWKGAYQETSKLRGEVAETGLKTAIGELKASAEAAAASAKDSAKNAEDAAKAAAGAKAPASLNLSLGSSVSAGEVVIRIDGAEAKRGVNQSSFSITKLAQGEHHIRVDYTPSEVGKLPISFEKSIDLKGGINAETITIN